MQVLLIHNDVRSARQRKQWIQKCYPGCHVTTCFSITQALEFIDVVGAHIDLCFTDVRMDDGSGIQVVRTLRESNWNVRIVFMADTDDYAMEAWRLCVNDYLMEPVTFRSIQHTLENCS